MPTQRQKVFGVTTLKLTPVVLRPTGAGSTEELRTLLSQCVGAGADEGFEALVAHAADQLCRC